MKAPANPREGAELQNRREDIRRGLWRLNTATILILVTVLALALVAVFQSQSSDRQRARAEGAELRARKQLFESQLAQARAERLTDTMGRRGRALEAIGAAVALQPQLAEADALVLRNEAIASLALPDIEMRGRVWSLPRDSASFDFDPQLDHFAVATSDGGVSLIRVSDGAEVRRFEPPAEFQTEPLGHARQVIFPPEGGFLLVAYSSGGILRYPLTDPSPPIRIPVLASRSQKPVLQCSPDGRYFSVVTESGRIQIFDQRPGAGPVAEYRGVHALAFHPMTNWVAAAVGNTVRILDWEGHERMPRITNAPAADVLSFRPDGKQLAIANGYLALGLWDLETREVIHLRAPLGVIYGLGYDPSGTFFTAALGDGISRLWDARTGELRQRLEGGRIVRFARTGTRVAFERPREGITVGRIAPRDGFKSLRWDSAQEYHRRFWSVDFSEDGRMLAAVDLLNLPVWDLPSGTLVTNFAAPSRRLSVNWASSQGSFVASSSTGISFLRPPGTGVAAPLPHDILLSTSVNNLGQSALAPDGHTLAIIVQSRLGYVLDLRDPEKRVTLNFEGRGALGHLAFSPNGRLLASSATEEFGVLVWEAATGKLLQKIRGPHGRVAFSPDGASLVLGSAREYRFWDTTTWEPDDRRHVSRDNLVETTGALAFSGDGKLLALARTRQLVQLMNPADGHELATLTAPESETVSWLRFSPGGDTLAVATFDGTIQLWNLGWLRGQLLPMGLDWRSSPAAAAPAALALQGGTRSRWGWVLALPMGAFVMALAFGVFAFNRQRHLLGAYLELDQLAAARANELEAAQTEVVHSQKMKALGTLAAGIAHDFNNLLSVIRMSNQLARESAPAGGEVAENTAEVEQAVQQGKKLVRSMLGYSRTEVEGAEPFQLADLVEDTVGLLSKQFLTGIALTLDLERGLPPVRKSRNRIEQILLNLVLNASEAMKGEGSLRLVVRHGTTDGRPFVLRPQNSHGYLDLLIIDSGPGIPAEVLPRIFEPFFTTKNRGSTRGTGLGLSMVYTIAEQDGLGVEVTSAPGQGTEFCIVVPIEDDSEAVRGEEGKADNE